jgi:hypothetical protein
MRIRIRDPELFRPWIRDWSWNGMNPGSVLLQKWHYLLIFQAPQLDEAGIKRILLQFEKKTLKNQVISVHSGFIDFLHRCREQIAWLCFHGFCATSVSLISAEESREFFSELYVDCILYSRSQLIKLFKLKRARNQRQVVIRTKVTRVLLCTQI